MFLNLGFVKGIISLENQSQVIQKYAEPQGFEVIRTYWDAGKSGLALRHRVALRQLLQDVVSGSPDYRAILVYAVSRWGRFQDTDESAHYEVLCKSAGVPVHYCAEMFTNDGSLSSLIMKALKRTMAGEYSRELGVKVLAGQKRLALLGFKQGAMPGYGLRRMLVSPTGLPKQILESGERKSIATDRVILVLGPAHEVQCVKDIFRMLVYEKRPVYAIARDLNRRGIPFIRGSSWSYQKLYDLITNPKYTGCHVWGRTSSRLYTRPMRLPKSGWILKHGAFEPIIDAETFAEAQKILAKRTFNLSDTELLESLRALLASKGRRSLTIIKNSPDVPSPSTFRFRFGSLRRAYELIGYRRPEHFSDGDTRHRVRALRDELFARIVVALPSDVSIVTREGRWRSRLRLSNGQVVSVLVVRCVRIWKDTRRWPIHPVWHERKFVTLLARLDANNQAVFDLHVFPNVDRRKQFYISLNDDWLHRGKPLSQLSKLCEVADRVGLFRKGHISTETHETLMTCLS
jgi:DNA invertase Pin-like site-specific DNA recombinase